MSHLPLRYGVIFWDNSTEREQAFKAQEKCLRAICNLKPVDSCKPHFVDLKILTLPCLYIYETAIFVRVNPGLFATFNSVRLRGKVKSLPSKSALLSKGILGMSPKLYNKIPKSIRDIGNIKVFKARLKDMLIEKAYYAVKEFIIDEL